MLSGKTSQRRGANYRGTSRGGKETADLQSVVKGATLLAEISDQDFCPSLPAGRVEKDLAAV